LAELMGAPVEEADELADVEAAAAKTEAEDRAIEAAAEGGAAATEELVAPPAL
jgi:hypothetical protein